jgi:hypothetical protein
MTYDEYKKHLEACGPLDDISKGLLSAFELGYGQGIKDGKTHFTKALAEPEQEHLEQYPAGMMTKVNSLSLSYGDKPRALRFAEMLINPIPTTTDAAIALELRRLHEENEALRQALDVDAVNISQERVDETAKRKPIAWMMKYEETGNISFFNDRYNADAFIQANPDWTCTPLYAKPFEKRNKE